MQVHKYGMILEFNTLCRDFKIAITMNECLFLSLKKFMNLNVIPY